MMNKLVSFLIMLFGCFPVICGRQISYTPQDSILVTGLLKEDIPAHAQTMIYFGEKFCGTPYTAATLEKGPHEHLVINERELDCTTFVENTLALALTYNEEKYNFADFARNLQLIRYRGGKIENYPSRLHYFSDWIADNTEKKIVAEITCTLFPVSTKKDYFFMSRNYERYPALRNNTNAIEKIRERENKLSRQYFCYIPKDSLSGSRLAQINDGDIIAITTDIDGLDISHVGIAYKIKGSVHLLHASQKQGVVIIDTLPLPDYLQGHKRQTGIRVIRPLFK